jgi:hypothetical protein
MGRVRPSNKNWKVKLSDYVPLLDNETNAHFAKHDQQFRVACELAKVQPTKEQASRYKRKHGAAYQAEQQAQA